MNDISEKTRLVESLKSMMDRGFRFRKGERIDVATSEFWGIWPLLEKQVFITTRQTPGTFGHTEMFATEKLQAALGSKSFGGLRRVASQ